MEYYYRPDRYRSTERINLKEYFHKFSELSENGKFSKPSEVSVFECINLRLSYEVMQKMFHDANVTEYCPIENPLKDILLQNSESSNKSKSTGRNPKAKESGAPAKDRIIPNTEFCVIVSIQKSVKFRLPEEIWQRQTNVTPSHEITVLGSQPLSALRDTIQCVNDMGFQIENTDLEEIPTEPDKQVKVLYPSGFIYIDGVFYNDMRHPKAIDYSEVIRTWAEDKKEITQLTIADIDETLISDLKPRFNYPYVYQHRGECEHTIVFKSAHLVTNSERTNRLDYPYISKLHMNFTHNCSICTTNIATRFIGESERLPLGVTYFCQACYISYNYVDGERIGTFQAYPLFDRCLKF